MMDRCQADIEEYNKRFGPSPLRAVYRWYRLWQESNRLAVEKVSRYPETASRMPEQQTEV